ncbi:glycosyltransferase family 25 protein [Candidatus Methylopumilus turicensis]|uniref:3-deoxy-D-manno-octulosonic-acid transferase n=1 Tax=Candidatus Methylopumilus turicensis TaxID=1581680 RepID=A0A0B7IVK5_9PROT|nr:glycosyltransferase family 25 protein [Candidatus Methylopumilus turicensis]CEN56346.1 3-deoxy-D-manno-octulosonic-acid transferase [Candidatus Methylopumilus turicensis]
MIKRKAIDVSAGALVDKVYVLSVKTFTERIAHIQREMKKHNIQFEFIFSHDIPEIDLDSLKTFESNKLSMAQISLVLKHIQAWKDALKSNYKKILIFEDDALLSKTFNQQFKLVIEEASRLDPGYLIFLGGADVKIPMAELAVDNLLLERPIATTEGYITDIDACKKRLQWLEQNKISLPADHLIKLIDQTSAVKSFWARPALVEQGSVTGMFKSHLDLNRQKHSWLFNMLRYKWNKHRRVVRRWIAIIKFKLNIL